jgi:hypothetical protein
VLFAALIFITVPFVLRITMYLTGAITSDWFDEVQKVVILRLDSLMYGIIAAYFFRFQKDKWLSYKNICLLFSVIIAIYLTVYPRLVRHDLVYLSVYQFNLESIASMLALPYFSQVKASKFKIIVFFFTFISVISYSMYLLNLTPVQGIMIPVTLSLFGLENNTTLPVHLLQYALFWIFVIVGSYLLYRYYEKPMTDLRDKIRFK